MPDPRLSDAKQKGQQAVRAGTATSAAVAITEVPLQGQQPKKPLNSYQIFLDDNRASLLMQVPKGINPICYTGKKAGEMWRALSATEKARFEQRAAELQSAYEAAVEAFKAKGGTMRSAVRKDAGSMLNEKLRRSDEKDVTEKQTTIAATVGAKGAALSATGKRRRVPQVKNHPIEPRAGGCGVFLKVNRASIKASKSDLDWDSKRAHKKRFDNLLEEYREQMKTAQAKGKSKQAAILRLPVQRADDTPTMLELLLGRYTASGWFWCLSSKPKHAGSRCATPLIALQNFLSKHSSKLSSATMEELEAWRLQHHDADFPADPATSLPNPPKQNPPTQQPPTKKARRSVQHPPVRKANANPCIQNPPSQI